MPKAIIVVGNGPSIEYTVLVDADKTIRAVGMLLVRDEHNGNAAIPHNRWVHVMPAESISDVIQHDSERYGDGRKTKKVTRL